MTIKYECYNSSNAFSSLILRVYKAMYVESVTDLENIESFKLDMINLACGVIRISNKCL